MGLSSGIGGGGLRFTHSALQCNSMWLVWGLGVLGSGRCNPPPTIPPFCQRPKLPGQLFSVPPPLLRTSCFGLGHRLLRISLPHSHHPCTMYVSATFSPFHFTFKDLSLGLQKDRTVHHISQQIFPTPLCELSEHICDPFKLNLPKAECGQRFWRRQI